jgi:hypothetical protein
MLMKVEKFLKKKKTTTKKQKTNKFGECLKIKIKRI